MKSNAFYRVFMLIMFLLATSVLKAQDSMWTEVDEGLFIGEFNAPQKSIVGDSKISMVKIDPKYFSFILLSASEHSGERMTIKEWCKKYHLISAVNAGMFQADGITSMGYMQNFDHLINPYLRKDYNTVLVFNPSEPNIPEVQIIDLKYQNFHKLRHKYRTLIQNLRMISCKQKNVWGKQDKIWSMIVLGIDKDGNVLFIFTRSPYSVHNFANILLSLPIDIYNVIYLEGGPEASLYFLKGDIEIDKFGSYETGFNDNDDNKSAWQIPNIIGVKKK